MRNPFTVCWLIAVVLACIVSAKPHGDAQGAPADWQSRIAAGNMIYSDSDPQDLNLFPVIGNGYIGSIVRSDYMMIHGVYNGRNYTDPSHRAFISSTVNVFVNESTMYASAIDVEEGVFYYRSALNSNRQVMIEQRWYAHRKFMNVLVHEISVQNLGSKAATINLSLKNLPYKDIAFKTISSPNPKATLQNGSIYVSEVPNGPLTVVALMYDNLPSQVAVPANASIELSFLTVAVTSMESRDPAEAAALLYKTCDSERSDLLVSHKKAWKELLFARLELEGDLNLAYAVNHSLYDILSSLNTNWIWSITPGGMPTSGYEGDVFWDCETWMYPTLLVMHPDIARSINKYRLERLDAALQKAKIQGYIGASFPWQSGFAGVEITPYPFPEGTEIHITGDIAHAVMQYYWASGDEAYLAEYFPLLRAIAVFWESRVEVDPKVPGQFVINHVMGPDESEVNVNNSIFTNAVAAVSLRHAIQASQILGKSVPDTWERIAANMKMPFDDQLQIHLQNDQYKIGQIINQADTALLQYPLAIDMPTEIAVNDLLYYQNHTDPNGMFTGDCSYSVAWLRLGRPADAQFYFSNTLLHLKPPFKVFTERIVGGIPHFVTGAGGFLQNIVFGYGGLSLTPTNITIFPAALPAGNSTATSITIRDFSYLGNLLTYKFNNTHFSISWGGLSPLQVVPNPPALALSGSGSATRITATPITIKTCATCRYYISAK